MEHRSKPSFWDRDELSETLKETYQHLQGERPKPGLYDDIEIKALEGELAELTRGDLIKEEAGLDV